MKDVGLGIAHAGELMSQHRSEKRLANIRTNLNTLSCAWSRVCRDVKPDHLLYEMEQRYCIKCNRVHWFFLKPIEFEQKAFDPNEYCITELRAMGYFAQFEDAGSR